MATTRTLLNRVLRGLRQDEIASSITSVSDTYHILLLELINVAKEETEESWDWQALRSTVTVTGLSSTVDYDLLASGQADQDVPEEARLLYGRDQFGGFTTGESSTKSFGTSPQVFDVTDSAEFRLEQVTPEQMERCRLLDNNETERPNRFALVRDEDNIKFMVHPIPPDVRTWKLRFVIPQGELLREDITTVLKVAQRPVWTKALYFANEERGEELGRPSSSLNKQAQNSLANAIARERTDEDDTSYPV